MFDYIFCLLEKCFFLGFIEEEDLITEEEEIYIRERNLSE